MLDPLSRLERVLETQRRMILSGDFDGLFALTAELGPLMAELERTDADPATLQRIRAAAVQNGDLILAGRRGFRSVERRLRELSEAARGLRTYTRDGRPENILKVVPVGRTY